MADARGFTGEFVAPDVSHLVTEDDTPVDNIFSAFQQALLVDALSTSWRPGMPFLAVPFVGLFSSPHRPPLVPDMLLSTNVEVPQDVWKKDNRSYFIWNYGKAPDVVVEIISNREGGETDRKVREYASFGVPYYVIFDPQRLFLEEGVVVNELHVSKYRPRSDLQLPEVGLSLTLWYGSYRGLEKEWLRWCAAGGELLLTGDEAVANEHDRAEAEHDRAERLAAKLREMGIDPENC